MNTNITIMKRNIIIISLLAIVAAVYAQETGNARTLLDKTAAKLSGDGGVSAAFSASGVNGTASGTIIVKGDKFRVQTSQAIVWFDGETQWVYSKSTDEVNISTPADAQQTVNPYKFITLYKDGYDLASSKSGTGYSIHLTAQGNKTIREMYVAITSSYVPTQIKLRTKNGWSTVDVSNFKSGQYSDATFKFSAKDYPSAEIIDLR